MHSAQDKWSQPSRGDPDGGSDGKVWDFALPIVPLGLIW